MVQPRGLISMRFPCQGAVALCLRTETCFLVGKNDIASARQLTGRALTEHPRDGLEHQQSVPRGCLSSNTNNGISRASGVGTGGKKREGRRWMRWFGIPWGLGITCLAALQLMRILRRERQHALMEDNEQITWQLAMFRLLPARPLSRAWGAVAGYELPPWLRRPLLGLYVWAFNCKMEEALIEDLRHYRTLLELFTRQLKHGTRTVSTQHELVCPNDGKVLHFGRVEADGKLEQIKGVTYALQQFLGPQVLNEDTKQPKPKVDSGEETARETSSGTNRLYHIILYLAPGDYHHFHSPADWKVTTRRHFPGELLTVAPWAVKTMPGLFALNERVVLCGQWKYGSFFFIAVGAYNVGSINIASDKDLQTNIKGRYKLGTFFDRQVGAITSAGLNMRKGDRLGHFSLGSSVVLVFEAPEGFQFQVEAGQSVKYGQPLGTVCNSHPSNSVG